MRTGVVHCFGARVAAIAFCVPFAAFAEIAATNLILAIGVTDYTNCVPVITATFPAGATNVAVEWCKTADGTFAELGAVANPEGTTFVYTNAIALVADKRWYRIAATDGDGTTCSAATAYTRFRRLERNTRDETELFGKYSPVIPMSTYAAAINPFDGNTGTYQDDVSYLKVGIDFITGMHIAGVRAYHRNARMSGRCLYGAATAEDYSAGNIATLSSQKFNGTSSVWDFVPTTNAVDTFRYVYATPDRGDCCEMQIYGWDDNDLANNRGTTTFGYVPVEVSTNFYPIVTATYEAGVDTVRLQCGIHEAGPFRDLVSLENPSGASVVFTNESAKVGQRLYYRVVTVNDGDTYASTPLSFTRFRRLERDPANESAVRSGYSRLTANTQDFDGNTVSYSANNPHGINFNEQVHLTAFRYFPRAGYAGRVSGRYTYAYSTAADYSAGNSVKITPYIFASGDVWKWVDSVDAENAYQICLINTLTPGGDLAEMQIYGWTEGDVEATGDPFYPTALAVLNGNTLGGVDVAWSGGKNITAYDVQYREQGAGEWATAASGLAGSVETNTVAGLAAGKTYEFRVKGYGADDFGYSPTATVYVYQLVPGSGTGLKRALMGPVSTRPTYSHNTFEYGTFPTVDIDVSTNSLFGNAAIGNCLVTYRGKLIAPLTGNYTFEATVKNSDGVALYIDGTRQFNAYSASLKKATVALSAGEHDFELHYRSVNTVRYLKFTWALENVWPSRAVPSSQFIPASDEENRAYDPDKTEGWDFSMGSGSYIARLTWLGLRTFRMFGDGADYANGNNLAELTRPVKGPFAVYADFDSTKNIGRPGLYVADPANISGTRINFIISSGAIGMKVTTFGDWGIPGSWINMGAGITEARTCRLEDKTLLFQTRYKGASEWTTRVTLPQGTNTYNGLTLNLTADTLLAGFSQFGAGGDYSDVTVANFNIHIRQHGLQLFLK